MHPWQSPQARVLSCRAKRSAVETSGVGQVTFAFRGQISPLRPPLAGSGRNDK